MVYHKITNGIVGDCNFPPNIELMGQAHELGMRLPTTYHQAVFDKELFRNDFKKFLVAYPWCPDRKALSLALQALHYRYQPFLMATTLTRQQAKDRIDKTKSPGYPWNLKYNTKQKFMDAEMPLIDSILDQIEAGLPVDFEFRGVKYDHLYAQSSPKGEFRPLDKLVNIDPAKRKTRVFLCGETITLLVDTMLYGQQNDNLLEAHKHGRWIQVGFSPFYGGWDAIARFLIDGDVRRLFDCLDFSHMEASLRENVLTFLYQMRDSNLILSAKESVMRNWAFKQNCYSVVIDPDGYLVQFLGNNVSGKLNTLTDNCLAVELVFLYSIAKEGELQTMEELIQIADDLHCVILGDDSVIPKHPAFANLINDASDLGFNLKPEAQSVDIFNAVFCNNRFVFSDGLYLPEPNFEKLRTNIYFHFKRHSWRLAYIKCCAYRTLAWMFPYYRKEAEGLCQWILTKKGKEMVVEVNPDVTLHSARMSYLPPAQIEWLWRGDESKDPHFNIDFKSFIPLINLFNFALSS